MRKALIVLLSLASFALGAADPRDDKFVVNGVVTWINPVWGFCVQNGEEAFFVEAPTEGEVALGSEIDAIGYPKYRGPSSGELRTALYSLKGNGKIPEAKEVTIDEVYDSTKYMSANSSALYARRVTLEGRLTHMEDGGSLVAVLLEDGGRTIIARVNGECPKWLKSNSEWNPRIRITGVCVFIFAETEHNPMFRSKDQAEILVNSFDDVVLVEDDAYFWHRFRKTLGIVLAVVGIVLFIVFTGLAGKWLFMYAELKRLELITDERKRMAADLHDSLEQHMAGVSMVLQSAEELDPNVSPTTREAIDSAIHMLTAAKAEAREAIWNLRHDALFKLHPELVFRNLAAKVSNAGLIRARCKLRGLPDHLPEHILSSLIYMIQEAITNAIKHGKAKNVIIAGDPLDDGGFKIEVANDGAPFDPSTALGPEAGHFGLSGMSDRARWCGLKVGWRRHNRLMVLSIACPKASLKAEKKGGHK